MRRMEPHSICPAELQCDVGGQRSLSSYRGSSPSLRRPGQRSGAAPEGAGPEIGKSDTPTRVCGVADENIASNMRARAPQAREEDERQMAPCLSLFRTELRVPTMGQCERRLFPGAPFLMRDCIKYRAKIQGFLHVGLQIVPGSGNHPHTESPPSSGQRQSH